MYKLLFLSFSCFIHSLCFSQTVLYTRGEVRLNDTIVQKETVFKPGDRFKTGENALAILDLGSGSKLKVESASEVLIETIDHASKGSLIQMARGKIIARARKIESQKDLFNISTPTASFGVRGTEFFVAVEQAEELDTWMCVHKGQVIAKGRHETQTKVVNQGEGVRINKDGTSDPRFLPWTKKLNWELDNPEDIAANDGALKDAYHDPLGQDYD
jgi:hypothetical protein